MAKDDPPTIKPDLNEPTDADFVPLPMREPQFRSRPKTHSKEPQQSEDAGPSSE